jgi:hypothetical protein
MSNNTLSNSDAKMSLGNMNNEMIETVEKFIFYNKEINKKDDVYSPKLKKIFDNVYNNIKDAQPYTYITIGTDGNTTRALYKNKNNIYFVSVYYDELESYYKL